MHMKCSATIVAFVCVLGSPCPVVAVDWWPFGGDKSKTAPPVADPSYPPAQKQFSTPRPLVGNLPVSERKGWMVDLTPPKRSWWPSLPKRSEAQPAQPGMLSGATSGVKSAGQKTAQATRNAWNSTSDFFRWGPTKAREEQYARVQQQRQQAAAEQKQPGYLARLFGAKAEPPGARTVPEFIAQERPGMSR
jgi:hypothetical protein